MLEHPDKTQTHTQTHKDSMVVNKEIISLQHFWGPTCGDYTFFFRKRHNYDQMETILAVHFAGKQSVKIITKTAHSLYFCELMLLK